MDRAQFCRFDSYTKEGAIEAKENGMNGRGLKNPVPVLNIRMKKQIKFFQYNLQGAASLKKQKAVKYLSQEQIEKAFQKNISALRKIKGFVNLNVAATIRVADANDPNKAVVLQSKHAV